MPKRQLINIIQTRLHEIKGRMIDGHCHLSAVEFEQDCEMLIEEAKKVGVEGIVAVCEFPGDFQNVLHLSEKYKKFVYPCIGVHPVQIGNRCVTLEDYEKAEEFIEKHKDNISGIGEVGLDFTPMYIKSPEDKETQRDVFRKQIRLAKRLDLPVNVHSRSAGRPVIDLLLDEGATKVLLHAFDGKPSVALRGVEAGFYFSIPPCIVRSPQKQKLAKIIPLSNMLLETDAPALGPEKQRRNVPANIMISVQEIASIRNLSMAEVQQETTNNAKTLFNLK